LKVPWCGASWDNQAVERRRASGAAIAVAIALAACSGSGGSGGLPADISGQYSVSVANTDNGCNYANWTIGQTAQNIEFDINQSGADVSGDVRGLAGAYFALLGIGTLQGTVTGSSASLTAVGTNSIKQGQCSYFVRATVNVTLTGNTVNGTVTYTNETNKAADCGLLDTCSSHQSVAGSRPPK
jgi:hypothetical protein